MSERPTKFVKPGGMAVFAGRLVLNLSQRFGFSFMGSRVLTVRGTGSGEARSTPVNPVTIVHRKYLVAARGTTEWVRNLRESGECELSLRDDVERYTAHELDDDAKLPVLRSYINTWGWEAGAFFDVPKNPSTEQLRRIAPLHPVFEIEEVPPGR